MHCPCDLYRSRALGGQYIAAVVKPFINYVIDGVIINMLVWPQRLVVPLVVSEEMTVAVARLSYRSQGVIKVCGTCMMGLVRVRGRGGGGVSKCDVWK